MHVPGWIPLALLALAGAPDVEPAAAPKDEVPVQGPPTLELPEPRAFADAVELEGVLQPADGHEIELWPERWSGELLFLRVVPHGTFVNRGDVLAELDVEAIDDQIEKAERDLRTAEIEHRNAVARAALDAEAERARRDEAEAELDRARRELQGWLEVELSLRERGQELQAQYQRHGIEDQEDELAQLEAMYADDELVDATEEIVLKRSRRNLARSRVSLGISEDRRTFENEIEVAHTTERKREGVEKRAGELDRLVRSQELEARSRADKLSRSEAALAEKRTQLEELRRDRGALDLRAPQAGILLHGGLDDYRPGAKRPEHRRGSKGALRTALFTVAEPDRFALAVEIGADEVARLRPGQGAQVRSPLSEEVKVAGSLRFERYPAAGASTHRGTVELERPLTGVVAGMRATAELAVDEVADAIVLPKHAVFGSGDEAHCWAAGADGTMRRLPVEVGAAKGGEVVVDADWSDVERVLLVEPK